MYPKIYLGLALALAASCFSFSFQADTMQWVWEGYPLIPYNLMGLSLLFFFLYIQQRRQLAEGS